MKILFHLLIKVFLSMIMLVLFSCRSNPSATEDTNTVVENENIENDFEVIAYYTGGTDNIERKTVKQLDQVIYSFLHLKGNELVVDIEEDSASIAYLVSLKDENPGLKVLVSLGGWGGCETCSDIFSTGEGIKEFSESVKSILEKYNADGIDLDWEYPVVEGFPGHPFKPEDRENFTSLVQKLRTTLGDVYEISFAAGGFNSFLEQAIEWEKVMPLLNRVNLMSYDLVHGGSKLTGHHTALFSTSGQIVSADNAIRYLEQLGVPSEKIVIGAAFYGRVWEDVEDTSNGLYQTGKFKEAVNYKAMDDFFQNNPGFENHWDSSAQATYSYNPQKRLFATYDDSLSIARKTEYAIEKKLGGIMFWQLSGDKKDGLLDVIYRVKKETLY